MHRTPLSRRSSSSSTASIRLAPRPPPRVPPHVEYEEVWENQRGTAIFGRPKFSAKSLLPTDRGPWSDERGNFRMPKDRLQLPDPAKWEWDGEWMIDMSGDVDPEGWQYAFNFGTFPWSAACGLTSYVRRRRWVRLRKPRPASPGAGLAALTSPPVLPTRAPQLPSRSPPVVVTRAAITVEDGPPGNLLLRAVGRHTRSIAGPRLDRERLEALAAALGVSSTVVRALRASMMGLGVDVVTAGEDAEVKDPGFGVDGEEEAAMAPAAEGEGGPREEEVEGMVPPPLPRDVTEDSAPLVDAARLLGATEADQRVNVGEFLSSFDFDASKVVAIEMLLRTVPDAANVICAVAASQLTFAMDLQALAQLRTQLGSRSARPSMVEG
ncbi:hypothetical protein AMAG_10159 [Allomyces macrogynus ATCC 38327]|uniref:Peroxin/Ferlin domain-containing protein n=1 Tax=Allomyces macrogynus (strain ATCC 38327) TaxID=578462 RepID=A0A0L0SR16_ALLM3|nr:hypothetical protein AMAG_10159 [Allomyces macrogynus ATCC 38327]|eukprot:KNE64824.1 hypothetical protein AMAG_10159 [Allomyces macrogynus ATCC 38327]